MRKTLPERAERGRVKAGVYGSDASYGPIGMFVLFGPCGADLAIVATDGHDTGWEHVSVSLARRIPNWTEMCFVKNLWWEDEETVVQFHPRKSEYISDYPHCLHMWKQVDQEYVLPPGILVGRKREVVDG